MSKFQLGVVVVFIALFGVAIFIFSGAVNGGSNNASSEVVLWGTAPATSVEEYLSSFLRRNQPVTISYVEIPKDSFSETFVEALASGSGPDLILVPHEFLLRHKDKLSIVPPATYPPRLFKDTYIDGASVYQVSAGLLGLPVAVDPLVLYYNKDLLAKNGVFNPPRTWDDIGSLAPLLLKRTAQGTIDSSVIALGESNNISHFKDIVGLLLLQSGSALTTEDPRTGKHQATLSRSRAENAPAEALRFYVSFSNPVSEFYSWNRSLPEALEVFLSGKVALYLGRASELFVIRDRNPNLNFDVLPPPQPESRERAVGIGSLYGVSVVKASKNIPSAYAALFELGGSDFSDSFSRNLSIPPAHRALVQLRPENPYMNVFFSIAQNTFAWLDPDNGKSDNVFRDMIRGVASGRLSPEEALYEADTSLQALVRP